MASAFGLAPKKSFGCQRNGMVPPLVLPRVDHTDGVAAGIRDAKMAAIRGQLQRRRMQPTMISVMTFPAFKSMTLPILRLR